LVANAWKRGSLPAKAKCRRGLLSVAQYLGYVYDGILK